MPIKPHCWYETIKPIVEPHDWGTGDLFPTFGMPSLITICYSRIWHHQFWLGYDQKQVLLSEGDKDKSPTVNCVSTENRSTPKQNDGDGHTR
jgi:hypothetical protein